MSRALGVPVTIFRRVVGCRKPDELYFLHTIAKKNPRAAGDVRMAWEPRDEALARAHKSVARRLDAFARQQAIGYPHPAVHGYVRGGSTRSNATPHCGARLLLRADIEEFFPTITSRRIAKLLRSLGMQTLPARLLAKFVTINGLLPLGLPESPVISNLVCLDMDRELQAMAAERTLRYTRYADDITFSGHASLPSKEDIRHILTRQGFRLSERKFRISKRGQAHFVTGLSVSERDYPHAPREMKRKLRQELYFCERFGLDIHAMEQGETSQKTFNRLYGLVNYVSYVERRQTERLQQRWGQIVRREVGEAAYATVQGREYRDIHLIVDESEFTIGEQKYLAICAVRLSELDRKQRVVRKLLVDYVTTPGAKGEIDALKDAGVHFTEVHYDLRTKTLDLMLEMLWSASVHFAKYESGADYESTWLKLFDGAVRQELMTADGIGLEILVEENDKVSSSALKRVVDAQFQRMGLAGSRRPRTKPEVKRVGKSDTPILTIPDFVLAAFRHYVLQVTDEKVLDFERIRDKVRYVHDHDLDAFYTRKKPFVELGSA